LPETSESDALHGVVFPSVDGADVAVHRGRLLAPPALPRDGLDVVAGPSGGRGQSRPQRVAGDAADTGAFAGPRERSPHGFGRQAAADVAVPVDLSERRLVIGERAGERVLERGPA